MDGETGPATEKNATPLSDAHDAARRDAATAAFGRRGCGSCGRRRLAQRAQRLVRFLRWPNRRGAIIA